MKIFFIVLLVVLAAFAAITIWALLRKKFETPLTPEQVAYYRARAAKEGYFHHLATAFDIFINEITGGMMGETISARCGRNAHRTDIFFLWRWIAVGMCAWLDLIQPGHGVKAVAGDLERAEEIEEVEEDALGVHEEEDAK